jgi:hypothetical protein
VGCGPYRKTDRWGGVCVGPFILTSCIYQRNEQSMNWNVLPPLDAVWVKIACLADEKQTPKSKWVADLSRVHF